MGKTIAGLAEEQGMEVVSTIDPTEEKAGFKEISKESVENAEVCIDFSQPNALIENVKKLAALKKNIVVGTTGWHQDLEKVRETVEKEGIGLIYAGNFSLGVNAFYRMLEKASAIMNNFPEYDVFCYEMHHRGKKDSPSGTAKNIEKILLKNLDRKKQAVEEKLGRQIKEEEMHFASVRGGNVPGTHSISFDSKADTIELKHTARNREGFALGSLKAASWIRGKRGLFSIDDLMKEIIK